MHLRIHQATVIKHVDILYVGNHYLHVTQDDDMSSTKLEVYEVLLINFMWHVLNQGLIESPKEAKGHVTPYTGNTPGKFKCLDRIYCSEAEYYGNLHTNDNTVNDQRHCYELFVKKGQRTV